MNNTSVPNEKVCVAEFSLLSAVFLTSLYGLTSVACSIGNGVVLIAIFQITTLRTVSNFFVASLAAADLLVGVFMNPFLIAKVALNVWQGNHWLSLAADFMWIQTTTATTFNLCAVSVDRFIAITAVFNYHTVMTRKKCFAVLSTIWVFSLVFASVRLTMTNPSSLPTLWITSTALTVIAPLLLISFSYVQIYRAAKSQARKMAEQKLSAAEVMMSLKNRKAALTAAIIISLFVITWIPSFVASCIELKTIDRCKKLKIDFAWFWLAFLCYLSSAINPWIYTIRVPEFKHTLRRILGRRRLRRELSRTIEASIRNSKTC